VIENISNVQNCTIFVHAPVAFTHALCQAMSRNLYAGIGVF